jgi:Domain of Unknown Function (DUF928)
MNKIIGLMVPAMLLIISEAAIAMLPNPPNKGAAPGSTGASSRGGCESMHTLKVLAPEFVSTIEQPPGKPKRVTDVWGLTTSEHPTIWFALSEPKDEITGVVFLLRDESKKTNKVVYQTTVQPKSGGIIGIPLPDANSGIALNPAYKWVIKLTTSCSMPKSIQAEGWIQRTSLSDELTNQIQQATGRSKVALYDENGLWYDAVTTLAELRRSDPSNSQLTNDWISLLEEAGLKDIASQPIVKP